LTAPRLWVVIALGAIAVMQLALAPNAIDLAYHVKAGELMVRNHELLRTDMLAWPTAGRPWLDQNWGAQLLLYGIWRVGGFPLIAVASAFCTVTAWALVVAACWRRTANLRLVAGAVLAGFLGSALVFAARPQMFSVLLFGIELYLLEVARTRPRVALWIPLLMPLWANLHGAFVVGLALIAVKLVAAAWLRDRRSALRFLLVGAASVAGLLVNPWGVRVLAYAALLPTNSAVTGMVTEWAPVSLQDPAGALLLAAIGIFALTLARAKAPGQAIEQVIRDGAAGRAGPVGGPGERLVRTGATDRAVRPGAGPSTQVGRGRPRRAGAQRQRGGRAGSRRGHRPAAGQAVAAPGSGVAPGAAVRSGGGRRLAGREPQPGRMFNLQPWGSGLLRLI
jgi:hypothetical protein